MTTLPGSVATLAPHRHATSPFRLMAMISSALAGTDEGQNGGVGGFEKNQPDNLRSVVSG